ncbi:MAG: YkgJ family cysteine cluster protein [Planctomycetaceae bacterium]
MASEPTPAPETVSADVALTVAGTRLEATVTVATAPARLVEMLPLFQSLADRVIGAVVASVEAQGRTISCRKGCGACCRQLVPISEVEARRIRDLVEGLPEPRRAAIKARFEEARRRLDEAGLLEILRHPDRSSAARRHSLGMDYFALRIACPFLDEESCSIHRDRPVACREYLVTSPAAHCANPTEETIEGVMMPAPIWPTLARVEGRPTEPGPLRWVPLILAPEWADAHPDEAAPRPGPEWVRAIFERLCGEPVPAPAPGLMGLPGSSG